MSKHGFEDWKHPADNTLLQDEYKGNRWFAVCSYREQDVIAIWDKLDPLTEEGPEETIQLYPRFFRSAAFCVTCGPLSPFVICLSDSKARLL